MSDSTPTKRPLVATLVRALKRGTPILTVEGQDPIGAATLVGQAAQEAGRAFVTWDAANGLRGIGDSGRKAINAIMADPKLSQKTGNPMALAAEILPKVESDTVIAAFDLWRPEDMVTRTGIRLLRDSYKATGRTLVVIGSDPTPRSMIGDVVSLDDALPDAEELKGIVERVYADCKADSKTLPELTPQARGQAVGAVMGLSRFLAEQLTVMSVNGKGIDMDALWARKVEAVSKIRGLSLSLPRNVLSTHGQDALVEYLDAIQGIGLVVWIDEVEKSLDTQGSLDGGVSKDQLGALLKWMDDGETAVPALLLVGPPGTGKSLAARAIAARRQLPLMAFDLANVKEGLVGSSEENIRRALRTIEASAGGRGQTLIIMTANRIQALPAEFRRRINLGTWMVDLPTDAALGKIKADQLKAYKLPADTKWPAVTGWSGADVRNCVDSAVRRNVTLLESARRIAGAAYLDPQGLDELRGLAETCRWTNAQTGDFYSRPKMQLPEFGDVLTARKVSIQES